MKKTMLWKIAIVSIIFLVNGCTTDKKVNGSVRWESAGTLVTVGPDTELSDYPDQLRSSVLGPTKLNSTRVETTKGVYVVSDKIGIVEAGTHVNIGFITPSKNQQNPSYLSMGGKQYEIVR